MRTLSFILAFAFVLAPSVAGLSDNLPGIGTFAYNGSHRHFTASGSRGCGQLIRTSNKKVAGKASCFFVSLPQPLSRPF